MMTPADIAQIEIDLFEVRDDNHANIIIRRGETTLSTQSVRIAGKGSGGKQRGDLTAESRGGITLLGEKSLDIQVNDRFTVNSQLYRVSFVRNNRLSATRADAEIIE